MDLVDYKSYFDALKADTHIQHLIEANETRREIPFTIYSVPEEPGVYTPGQQKLIARDIFDNRTPDIKSTNKAIQNLLSLTDLETASKIVNDLAESNPNNIEYLNSHFKGISSELKKKYSQITKEGFIVLLKNMVEKQMTEGYVQEKLKKEMTHQKYLEEKAKMEEQTRIKKEEKEFLTNVSFPQLEQYELKEELSRMKRIEERLRRQQEDDIQPPSYDELQRERDLRKRILQESSRLGMSEDEYLATMKSSGPSSSFSSVKLTTATPPKSAKPKKQKAVPAIEPEGALPPPEASAPLQEPKPKRRIIKNVGSSRARKIQEKAEQQGEGIIPKGEKPLKLVKLTFGSGKEEATGETIEMPKKVRKYTNLNKWILLGNLQLNYTCLMENVLSVRYNSTKRKVTWLPNTLISKDLLQIILEILRKNSYSEGLVKYLNDKEKKILFRLLKWSGKFSEFPINPDLYNTNEKDIKRFEVVKGALLAGNTSPLLLKELKSILMSLSSEGILPRNEISNILNYI